MRMHDPAIYRAEVTHTRTGPIRHRLRHSVFYLYLDLYKLDDFARRSRIFSRNHFNLLSFFDRDHGCRDGRPIAVWVETQLKHAGFFDPQGRIFLLTLPRILGYVFNPSPQGLVHQETAKRFYVSPFMGMDALYRFRLNIPAEVLMIGIRATTVEGIGLAAFLRGRQRPLTDWELLRAVFAMPFMTVNVIASIHIHAMRLWLKGAIFHRKPPAPRQTVTIDPSEPAET
jgi:DUF1365 family protein